MTSSIETFTGTGLRVSFIWIMLYHDLLICLFIIIFSALPSFLVRNLRTTLISPNGILVFPKMVVGPRGDHYQEGACLAESVTTPPLTDVENHVEEVLFRISVLFLTSECKLHPSLQILFKDSLSDVMMTLETFRENFIYHNNCAIIYNKFA